jgi:hypothetical protein
MLIFHRGLDVDLPHHIHDQLHQTRSEVMPGTVKHQFFRQSGLLTGCAKLLVDLGDTLRRSASRLTSSMTGSAPAPVPTTSQRHFHGISSSSESGV